MGFMTRAGHLFAAGCIGMAFFTSVPIRETLAQNFFEQIIPHPQSLGELLPPCWGNPQNCRGDGPPRPPPPPTTQPIDPYTVTYRYICSDQSTCDITTRGGLAKTLLAIKAALFKHMAETHANTAGQMQFGLHTDTGPALKMFPGERAKGDDAKYLWPYIPSVYPACVSCCATESRRVASAAMSVPVVFRPLRSLGSHIAGRRRIAAHFGNRIPAQSENPRRLAPLFPSMKTNRRTAA
jgi:hypothetical protein